MSMEGLAKKLADHELLRGKLLREGTLLSWPSKELQGVCKNQDAQKMNYHLLIEIADHWCPQWESPAMIPVEELKSEVLKLTNSAGC